MADTTLDFSSLNEITIMGTELNEVQVEGVTVWRKPAPQTLPNLAITINGNDRTNEMFLTTPTYSYTSGGRLAYYFTSHLDIGIGSDLVAGDTIAAAGTLDSPYCPGRMSTVSVTGIPSGFELVRIVNNIPYELMVLHRASMGVYEVSTSLRFINSNYEGTQITPWVKSWPEWAAENGITESNWQLLQYGSAASPVDMRMTLYMQRST